MSILIKTAFLDPNQELILISITKRVDQLPKILDNSQDPNLMRYHMKFFLKSTVYETYCLRKDMEVFHFSYFKNSWSPPLLRLAGIRNFWNKKSGGRKQLFHSDPRYFWEWRGSVIFKIKNMAWRGNGTEELNKDTHF